MSLTNPPAIITQFSTQLAACAAWPGGTNANHWYPSVPWASASFPLAVLSEETGAGQVYSAGTTPLPSGTLKATIHYPQTGTGSDDGSLETLGRTLLAQLLAQPTGIVFRSGSVGMSGTSSMAEQATGTATFAIEVSLEYGLQA